VGSYSIFQIVKGINVMMAVDKETLTEKGIRLGNFQQIDPKITSEYLEIGFVVDNILFDMQFRGIPIPPQKKYLDNLVDHVAVIILNLYDAYLSDPERYVGYLRRSAAYKKKRGYKGFQFGYQNIIRVTDFLENYGYIGQDKGYPSSDKYEAQISKMRATAKLIDLIEKHKQVTPDMIKRDISSDEVIIVKGLKPRKRWRVDIKDGVKKKKKYQPKRKICKTPDNSTVRKMRENVENINYIMEQADITLDITDQELRELNVRLNIDNDPYKQAVDFRRKFLHRVFLDRRLDRGGRFYGPWYQNIYKEYRPKIMINGAAVVEVDYSGYHPRILYGLKGLSLPEDPYTLDDYPDSDIMRGFLKPFLLMIINAKTPDGAMDAIREANYKSVKAGKGSIKPPEIKSFSRNDLRPVIDKLMEKHKPISDYFFSGFGNTLQWYDSQIAEITMLHFAYQGYPCLPVHDSFLVDTRLEDELKEIMEKAFVHSFKHNIKVTDNWEQLIANYTPEKVERDLLPMIMQGLADGTIDRDEFAAVVREKKKSHKELMKQFEALKAND
jgi:hypothetical protein